MGYKFVKTDDGSVGLYDEDVEDIYHSSSGAYKEATDKFIIPAQIERFKNSTCRVLDICYGIGYNTKALLKYCAENNYNISFKIDALELNNELIYISPFIKNFKPDFFDFEIDKFILNSCLNNFSLDFCKIKSVINQNKKFLTLCKPDFDDFLKNKGYCYGVKDKLNSFLHNIYYHNITNRLKIGQKPHFLDKSSLKWHTGDARKTIFELSTKYDLIFIDAFTAAKQPILWSEQFLNEVVKRLDEQNGILLSYSVSSPFRKSLINLGLHVGKFYTKNINSTLASFNKNLLKYKLDDFELGLLNTRAGIPYEDTNLKMSCEEIINLRNKKISCSELESTSKYYRRLNRKHGKY